MVASIIASIVELKYNGGGVRDSGAQGIIASIVELKYGLDVKHLLLFYSSIIASIVELKYDIDTISS